MEKALLIAEKPSLRRTIENVYNKNKGSIPYEITFMEQRGHLITLKNPNEIDEDLKEWSWDNLPIHPEEHGGWQYKVIKEEKVGKYLTAEERYKAIKQEVQSGKYDFVINAGDPDQEGELLVRIVLTAVKCNIPIKRYWSNETTDNKVLEALKNLRDDEHDDMLVNLLAAAYARQHSDYRFGMNISRAATLKLGGRVACGRVKTPIMSIVCRREKEIANFTPTTVYGVKVNYDDFSGQLYDPGTDEDVESDDKENDQNTGIIWFDTEEEAQNIIDSLGNTGTVVKYESKRVKTFAPKLFKLATAQIAAGKMGYSSSETLNIIQSLYDKGFLTYPRTDCEYLSSEENYKAMLRSANSVPALQPFIASIDESVIDKVKATKKWVNDKALKESGHSALVPTSKVPDFDNLSKEEQDIYTLVCRQFVAIFLPPLIQDKTLLVVDIDGKSFKSTGKTLIDEGYSTIFGTKFTDMNIPTFCEDDSVDVVGYEISEKTSTCPKRFTDADLIAVCEAPHKFLEDKKYKDLGKNLKIGTPATRSNIIEELITRDKYLQRATEKKTTYIIPTDMGIGIYENLKDCEICKVDMTGEWEIMLENIRAGELSLKDMEASMKSGVEQMIDEIKDLEIVTPIKTKKEPIGTCPECGGDLINGPKSFFCSNYKEKECKMGAFKGICDSTLRSDEFLKLINHENIIKKIKKGDKSWDQELTYNFDEHKVEFVRKESTPAGDPEETDYNCPNCDSVIVDDGRVLKCSDDCGFKLWKTQYGKALSDEEIENFFTRNDTGLVKGLISKKGKKFDAHIILNDDMTGSKLKFEERD